MKESYVSKKPESFLNTPMKVPEALEVSTKAANDFSIESENVVPMQKEEEIDRLENGDIKVGKLEGAEEKKGSANDPVFIGPEIFKKNETSIDSKELATEKISEKKVLEKVVEKPKNLRELRQTEEFKQKDSEYKIIKEQYQEALKQNQKATGSNQADDGFFAKTWRNLKGENKSDIEDLEQKFESAKSERMELFAQGLSSERTLSYLTRSDTAEKKAEKNRLRNIKSEIKAEEHEKKDWLGRKIEKATDATWENAKQAVLSYGKWYGGLNKKQKFLMASSMSVGIGAFVGTLTTAQAGIKVIRAAASVFGAAELTKKARKDFSETKTQSRERDRRKISKDINENTDFEQLRKVAEELNAAKVSGNRKELAKNLGLMALVGSAMYGASGAAFSVTDAHGETMSPEVKGFSADSPQESSLNVNNKEQESILKKEIAQERVEVSKIQEELDRVKAKLEKGTEEEVEMATEAKGLINALREAMPEAKGSGGIIRNSSELQTIDQLEVEVDKVLEKGSKEIRNNKEGVHGEEEALTGIDNEMEGHHRHLDKHLVNSKTIPTEKSGQVAAVGKMHEPLKTYSADATQVAPKYGAGEELSGKAVKESYFVEKNNGVGNILANTFDFHEKGHLWGDKGAVNVLKQFVNDNPAVALSKFNLELDDFTNTGLENAKEINAVNLKNFLEERGFNVDWDKKMSIENGVDAAGIKHETGTIRTVGIGEIKNGSDMWSTLKGPLLDEAAKQAGFDISSLSVAERNNIVANIIQDLRDGERGLTIDQLSSTITDVDNVVAGDKINISELAKYLGEKEVNGVNILERADQIDQNTSMKQIRPESTGAGAYNTAQFMKNFDPTHPHEYINKETTPLTLIQAVEKNIDIKALAENKNMSVLNMEKFVSFEMEKLGAGEALKPGEKVNFTEFMSKVTALKTDDIQLQITETETILKKFDVGVSMQDVKKDGVLVGKSLQYTALNKEGLKFTGDSLSEALTNADNFEKYGKLKIELEKIVPTTTADVEQPVRQPVQQSQRAPLETQPQRFPRVAPAEQTQIWSGSFTDENGKKWYGENKQQAIERKLETEKFDKTKNTPREQTQSNVRAPQQQTQPAQQSSPQAEQSTGKTWEQWNREWKERNENGSSSTQSQVQPTQTSQQPQQPIQLEQSLKIDKEYVSKNSNFEKTLNYRKGYSQEGISGDENPTDYNWEMNMVLTRSGGDLNGIDIKRMDTGKTAVMKMPNGTISIEPEGKSMIYISQHDNKYFVTGGDIEVSGNGMPRSVENLKMLFKKYVDR